MSQTKVRNAERAAAEAREAFERHSARHSVLIDELSASKDALCELGWTKCTLKHIACQEVNDLYWSTVPENGCPSIVLPLCVVRHIFGFLGMRQTHALGVLCWTQVPIPPGWGAIGDIIRFPSGCRDFLQPATKLARWTQAETDPMLRLVVRPQWTTCESIEELRHAAVPTLATYRYSTLRVTIEFLTAHGLVEVRCDNAATVLAHFLNLHTQELHFYLFSADARDFRMLQDGTGFYLPYRPGNPLLRYHIGQSGNVVVSRARY